MVDVPTSANLRRFVANNQGQTIDVPGANYSVSRPIPVGPGTRINFNGTTIDPGSGTSKQLGDGAKRIFSCSGSNWHVGGDLTILQEGKNWVQLASFNGGSGQFGDGSGRITVKGHARRSVVSDVSRGTNREPDSLRMFYPLNGNITIKNVTHPGGPPGVGSGTSIAWTNTSGNVTVEGCDFRNTGSNGFYCSTMGGHITIRDSYFKNINVGAVRPSDGVTMERVNVVATPQTPRQETHRGAVNASFMTKSGWGSNITLRECHYLNTGVNGIFLRVISGGGDVVVDSCQWTGYRGGIHGSINPIFRGNNGGNPEDWGGIGPGVSPPELSEIVDLGGENTIEFVAPPNLSVTDYSFEVADGTIEPGEGANIGDGTDDLTNNKRVVNGTVGGGGSDSWSYTGKLDGISAPGIDVYINGESVTGRLRDLLSYYETNWPPAGFYPDNISICNPSTEAIHYMLEVTGAITGRDGSVESTDSIDGSVVQGMVADGCDKFNFEGPIKSLSWDQGTLNVWVNGMKPDLDTASWAAPPSSGPGDGGDSPDSPEPGTPSLLLPLMVVATLRPRDESDQ